MAFEAYEEYIKSVQKYAIDAQNEGPNKIGYRYRLYLEEGYRRYGGSARHVLRFVKYAASRLAFDTFDSPEDSLHAVKALPDEHYLRDAIKDLAETKVTQGESSIVSQNPQ